MKKPRIFIGSSAESLNIADATGENLEFNAEVTIWRSGVFNLSSNALDDLILKSKSVDFAAFIFSPDDIIKMRTEDKNIVRDNVLFELGLFIGALGKDRCFIIKPRDTDLHFPSDLLGIIPTDYDSERSDNNLTSSLTYASTQIKRCMEKQGIYTEVKMPDSRKLDINNILNKISDNDLYLLGSLLESYNSSVTGCASWDLSNNVQAYLTHPQRNLSLIKLQRSGLIEKRNESDFSGNEFFSYSLTDYGIDICLKNEDKISCLFNPSPTNYRTQIPTP